MVTDTLPQNGTPHTPDGTQSDSGRDARGRFAAGNPGGPGNPFNRRLAELRSAALEAVSREDMLELFAMLKFKAKTGDLAATKIILQYTLGKPGAPVQPDRIDLDEWQILTDSSVSKEDWVELLKTFPATAANEMTHGLWPLIVMLVRQKLADDIRQKYPPEPSGEADTPPAAAAAPPPGSNGAAEEPPASTGGNGASRTEASGC